MDPIALVIPWYGDDIRGGAERECNYLAHSLTNAGAKVEVFTTCVKDAASDRGVNTLPAGARIENRILVRRFRVRSRDVERFTKANLKIYHNEPFTLEDERAYFEEDINSPEMYRYIREHKKEYACFIFIPYMYGPTYNGSVECMEKAFLIPCLHDESYAYMTLLKERIPQFKGIIFLSKPECELANRLYRLTPEHTAILGAGVDTDWFDSCNPGKFREKYKINSPFIVFAGRKDAGKKADELVEFFTRYKSQRPASDLKLVLLGGGTIEIPKEMREEILDLGFVSDEDKHNALSAAVFLCNPSHFESFSIVIMESWLAKRPVLVSEHCEVTKNFCLESNGGLYYNDFIEFCICVDYILNNKAVSDKMGIQGFDYVIHNYTHETIADKYLSFISKICEW